MDRSFRFYAKINNVDNRLNFPSWDLSIKAFDSGKYREAFELLLKYLDSTISFPKSGDVDMKFPHGSVIINLKLNNSSFSVEAPFLKLPETPAKIGLMRQVLELNFNYLTISRISLKGTELVFFYEDRIENSDPEKIFYLLEEICYCADFYDDVFVEKFGAVRLSNPVFNKFNPAQLKTAREYFTKALEAGIAYAEHFESKRLFADALDSMSVCMMQADFAIAPQGSLGHMLSDAMNGMKTGASQEEIVIKTKAAFRQMLAYDQKKFEECMFYPKYLVPFKKYAGAAYVQDYIAPAFGRMRDSMRSRNYIYASLDGLYSFYSLFWNNALPKEISVRIEKALAGCSEKPWENTAKGLYQAMEDIMKIKTGA